MFISYAHESDGHIEQVRDLWVFLRQCGIDAKLDRAAAQRRQDWALWMGDQVRESDHVLVVASAAYRERAEGRSGPDVGKGVQWEARLIRDAFYRDQSALDRFVPVVLPGQSLDGVPDFLAPATSSVYTVRDYTLDGADELLRLLLDQPAEVEPPLGTPPVLGSHTSAAPALSAVRHEVDLHVEVQDDGQVLTQVLLGGTLLGEQVGALPDGVRWWHVELRRASGADRLVVLGKALWGALFDDTTGGRLADLINRSPLGSVVDIVVHLPEELSTLPVELLRLPDGRLAATVAGVRFARRLEGVERPSTPPLAGPLKILAAVAAPAETSTPNPPLDVEAEMQALLDAVTDLDLDSSDAAPAQVRILEVASLDEIGRALAADQYHVLHLSAHGSDGTVELEDEDGRPVPADADRLVAALRAGERPLPLVVLSSCRGAATGTAGLAAALVRHGADRVIAMQASISDDYATELARALYTHLARTPDASVSSALATARRQAADLLTERARKADTTPLPEFAVPTLLCGGSDTPLTSRVSPAAPLTRPALAPSGTGVRELSVGRLIGRRDQVRTAMAVLRATTRDRERVGDWAGVVLTGIGGIGKTAVAGRIATRAREEGWVVAEHVGTWKPDALIDSVAHALAPEHADAVTMLRDPGLDSTAKLGLVARLLGQARLVLLFDDFEQNLDIDGQYLDPGFAQLFSELCEAARIGSVLVTCRHPVPDGDSLLRIDLPPLSLAEQRRLFLRLPALRALSTEDRRLVAATIGGHPRLLEFLDVLVRQGTATDLRHVTAKLRALAKEEHIDLRPERDLTSGLDDAVRLGSRDILLDTLTTRLTPEQHELALQSALARVSFTVADLAHTRHGPDPTPDQLVAIARDTEHLRDLTLLTSTPDDELLMHPWVATSLNRHHTPDGLLTRHERAAAMRQHRITSGRGSTPDITDLIYHLAALHEYDTAAAIAAEACDMVGGEVAVAALLADTVPLIPTDHHAYITLARRECQALQIIGLFTATTQRLHNIHAITAQHVTADPSNGQYQRDLGISHESLGDLAMTRGDTAAAEGHFQAILMIAERLATAEPDNAQYQHDLGISHNKLGDLAITQGHTAAAEQHFRADLLIAERLATADPDNAQYQRDLGISHSKLGDLAITRGDTAAAEQHFRADLLIIERLATAHPDNAQYQHDLGISHNKLGDLAMTQGHTSTAEQRFQAGLAITERLATSHPDNAEYQRELSISHERLGDLAMARGDTAAAEQRFQTALDIRERLATADPDNAEYQRDVSISHDKLGDLAMTRGDTAAAEQHLQADLLIAERLATAHPDNAQYQRDLGVSHNNLGDLAMTRGDTATAEQCFQTALDIRERLATADPDNAQYQRDVSISHNRLGDLAMTRGDTATAEQHVQTALLIVEQLAAADPDNAQYQRELRVHQAALRRLTDEN